jgi:hypothetical protein
MSHGAGLLGIPGNITSCTLLHGIHLILICGSLSRCRVIGDDAIVYFLEGESFKTITVRSAICLIGEIAEDKFETWLGTDANFVDEHLADRWTYEKRPFNRVADYMWKGKMTIWPTLENLGIHSNGFTIPPSTAHQRRKAFIKQHIRLLSDLPATLSQLESGLVEKFSSIGYSFHQGLRRQGGYDSTSGLLYAPTLDVDFTFSNWCRIYGEAGGVIRIKSISMEERSMEFEDVSATFSTKGSGVLTFGVKMGWLTELTPYVWYSVADLISRSPTFDIDYYLFGSHKFVKLFVVTSRYPSWFSLHLPRPIG